MLDLQTLGLIIVCAPLLGAILAGLLGKVIGRRGAHSATIGLMVIAFVCATILGKLVLFDGLTGNHIVYTWAVSGSFQFDVGFLIDPLTAVMVWIVTFVSLAVHIYSMGYMHDDPGYQRFFSYVSLFTFAMLMLVMANNFMQLFFGWEGVGLVSYLLIGFWFHKETAAVGSMKAFLVNRVGDFGFLLGIAAILDYFGTVNYEAVFAKASSLSNVTMSVIPGTSWSVLTVISILLFIGAMGKSAQVPLHVWLPESMEGPTPISALIHAATMVTAGVYMVARMSPLFEWSPTALSMVMILGATGALFLGLLAFVENDIKRVIAFSTMSQLGYMMAANGASAFPAGIFHLLTHACFKALLFLAAGSLIIAMHHEQDLRKMGGLRKYLPITYVTFFIGACALAAIPPFAGYYSKDAVIEAVHLSHTPGAMYAYVCLLFGSFVTGYYIFRAFFLAFHTEERFDDHTRSHLREYWAMTIPLILLAIPSVILGMLLVGPMLYDTPTWLSKSVYIAPALNVLNEMREHYEGVLKYALESVTTFPFWFAISGVFSAWLFNVAKPEWPGVLKSKFKLLYLILVEKYGFDRFNDLVIVRGTRVISDFFYNIGDAKLLDAFIVNGSGRGVLRMSSIVRRLQTGYLYHYVLVMIVGLLAFLLWLLVF